MKTEKTLLKTLLSHGINLLTAFLFVITIGLGVPASAQTSDVTPPELTGFTINPTTVDITSGNATATFTLNITDDLSGAISYQRVYLRSPSGDQYQYVYCYNISGTPLDGEWARDFTFPEHSELGTWKIYYVYLEDEVGNNSRIDADILDAMGFPTEIEIISDQDTDPPVLTNLTITPLSIDTSDGDQLLTVTVTASDNPSGIDYMRVYLRNPSGTVSQYRYLYSSDLTDGTIFDGTWQDTITIPQFSESGTWRVYSVSLRDKASNYINLYESDLQSMGLDVEIEVNSDEQDISPPELVDLDISPIFINTTKSSAYVDVSLELTDDLSGIDYGYARFISPSGGQDRYAYIRSTESDNIWEGQAFFPQYSEDGTWRISYFYMYDNTGNYINYNTSALAAMNLPVELVVVKPIQDLDGSITDPTAGGEIIDDTFGDRAKITVPPDVLTTPTDVAIDVFMDPLDLPTPSGFMAPGTRFVNIEFIPEPSFPLPAPGLTLVLPLPNPIPAGTIIQLFRVDTDTGNLVAAVGVDGLPVFGTVDEGNMSVTFTGVSHMSTLVGLVAPEIEGDIDLNGCVDREDYSILMLSIRNGEPFNSLYDLNGDGVINRADARTLVGLFTNSRGASCPP